MGSRSPKVNKIPVTTKNQPQHNEHASEAHILIFSPKSKFGGKWTSDALVPFHHRPVSQRLLTHQ